MIDAVKIIKLAMESLKMNETGRMDDKAYNGLLHDLKNFVIDLQNVKHKVEELSDNERIDRLEERTNMLLLKICEIEILLNSICRDAEYKHNHKTRKQS